jgi:hypothetical protein
MAKGKHSTALFEVIHSGKGFEDRGRRQSILRTPKWWFKGRTDAPDADQAAGTVVAVATANGADPAATKVATAQPSTKEPTLGVTVAEPVPAAAPPVRVTAPAPAPLAVEPIPVDLDAPAAPDGAGDVVSPLGGRGGIQVRLNPDRHEVTLRLRYTTALVTGFAVLMIVSLAYVTGRHAGRGPETAEGSDAPVMWPTDKIRKGPPNERVMDVGGSRDRSGRPLAASRENVADRSLVDPSSPTAKPRPAKPDGTSGGQDAMGNPRRTLGLNYVLIQSYRDHKDAQEACDLLQGNGIDCTIEQNLRGFPPQWVSVVGTEGFTGISRPDYQTYVRTIERISDQKYAQKKKSWKAFQPMPYKWGKDDPK